MIKVHTSALCPCCIQAVNYLKSKNIQFKEINSSVSELIKISGQTNVPVIEINGMIIVGFKKEAIESALLFC